MEGVTMDDRQQPRRVTIRLTPYQARALWKLRNHNLVEGQLPRSVTAVLVESLLRQAREISDPVEHDVPAASVEQEVQASNLS
jgi:hypothetical protein